MEWYWILLIVLGSVLVWILLSALLYKPFFKRFYDIFLSIFALILLGLPLLVVAICVRKSVGKPVLFKQRRIGKNNKEFKLLKFRSMTEERDENGIYLPDEQRITKFGNFIRKTSIDELPSLINIIKGEMSIIGPRPLPVRYLPRYNEEQIKRHNVRPGLSTPGIASGRNIKSWEQEFEEDIWYINHISMWTDIKAIFATVGAVFSRKGAVSDDGGARGEFIGIADINDLNDDEGNYMKIK